MMPTASRTARHSPATASNQLPRWKEWTSFGSVPSGANQLARSQPALEPNTARFSLSWA